MNIKLLAGLVIAIPCLAWALHTQSSFWDTKDAYLAPPRATLSGTYYVGSDPDADDKKHGIAFSYSTLTITDSGSTIKSLGRPLNEPGFNGDFYVAPGGGPPTGRACAVALRKPAPHFTADE